MEREETFQNYLDDLEKKERDEYKVASEQRSKNLRSLFEENKLSLDVTWEKCQAMFASNIIFKTADNLEKLR